MAIVNSTVADLVGSNDKLIQNRVNLKLDAQNPLVLSGAASTNPIYNELLAAGPRKFSMPYLNALPTDEMNVSGDDLNAAGKTAKMTAGEFDAVKHYVNMGFGAADLASMVTGVDVPGEIAQGITDYWTTIYTDLSMATLKGVRNANEDLDYDPSVAYSAAEFGKALINSAASKHERLVRQQRIAFVTPEELAVLQMAEGNAFVPASQTDIGFPTYFGVILVVTRSTSGLAGAGEKIIPVLSAGALSFAQSGAGVDFEIERVANGGYGAGGDILHSRRQVLIMPQGMEWAGAARVGNDKAGLITALKLDTNWGVVQSADRIGISFLKFDVA